MIATIRDRKWQGNNAIYVRFRDEVTNYWDFITSQWVISEGPDCRSYLTEHQDLSTLDSRYQAIIDNTPSGSYIAEYVRLATEMVIGEDVVNGSPPPVAGIGANLVTVTATDGTHPVPEVLVQAWQGAELLAAVLTDSNGQAVVGLPTASLTLVLSKTSWGSFPQHPITVVPGPQSVTIQGTALPPGAVPTLNYGILITVGDVDTRLLMGYSAIEVWSSDDECRTWQARTAPVATPALQAHLPLMPGTYAYSFLDPQGVPTRRYRWRYSANGAAPVTPYFKWVYGTQRASNVPVSIGTMRFVGADGILRQGTLLVAALDGGILRVRVRRCDAARQHGPHRSPRHPAGTGREGQNRYRGDQHRPGHHGSHLSHFRHHAGPLCRP